MEAGTAYSLPNSVSSGTSATRILVLKREDPASWALVPALCARVRQFCTQYDSMADPEQMVDVFHRHFVADAPQILGIVALQNERIVAHLLVSLDQWMGCKVVTILQYEQDEAAHIPPESLQRTFAWLREWAHEHGAQALQALVRTPALSRAFATHYGFHPTAVILRQPVGD